MDGRNRKLHRRCCRALASPGVCGHLVHFSKACTRKSHRTLCFTSSAFPEMCNLLYSICHVFAHRCSLSSCTFMLRYCLCLFYVNAFMALKRSYLNLHFTNFTVLWSMDVQSQNHEGNMVWSPQLPPIETPSWAVRSMDAEWQPMRSVSCHLFGHQSWLGLLPPQVILAIQAVSRVPFRIPGWNWSPQLAKELSHQGRTI